MEKAYFIALWAVLLIVAALTSVRLFRGPPLYPSVTPNVRDERVASRLLLLFLSLGALAASIIVAAALLS